MMKHLLWMATALLILMSAAAVTVPHLCSCTDSPSFLQLQRDPHPCSCSDNPSFLQLQWQVLISVAEVTDLHLCSYGDSPHLCSCSDTPSSLYGYQLGSCSDSPSFVQLQQQTLIPAAAVTIPHFCKCSDRFSYCSCNDRLISAAAVIRHSFLQLQWSDTHFCSCSDRHSSLQLQWLSIKINMTELGLSKQAKHYTGI